MIAAEVPHWLLESHTDSPGPLLAHRHISDLLFYAESELFTNILQIGDVT